MSHRLVASRKFSAVGPLYTVVIAGDCLQPIVSFPPSSCFGDAGGPCLQTSWNKEMLVDAHTHSPVQRKRRRRRCDGTKWSPSWLHPSTPPPNLQRVFSAKLHRMQRSIPHAPPPDCNKHVPPPPTQTTVPARDLNIPRSGVIFGVVRKKLVVSSCASGTCSGVRANQARPYN